MIIVLLHRHYDEQHLTDVKRMMQTKGAPAIRCIWSQMHGCWLAIEGCHRLRAAHELGLTPTVIDISGQKTVRMQQDGGHIRASVNRLLSELNDNAPYSAILSWRD